jgi:hypothetical protein
MTDTQKHYRNAYGYDVGETMAAADEARSCALCAHQ